MNLKLAGASRPVAEFRPQAPSVALVAGSARTLIGPRSALIGELVARRCPVTCISPAFTPEQEATIAVRGADVATFEMEPGRLAMLRDWQVRHALATMLRERRPDVVIGIGERVMALAMLAARSAKIDQRIAVLNGFRPRGLPFDGLDDPLRAAPRLLARALKSADHIVFHNRDDERALQRIGALPADAATHVVPGAGVDLAAFPFQPLPPVAPGMTFLMVAALDSGRGVLAFCEAAARLKQRAPRARFLIAGPAGEGASGLRPDALRPFGDAVTYLGALTDVRPALAECHVLVHPSFAEGMPGIVMEAAATGRPVITTDTPGCRDAVDDCVNGMLVPAGDVDRLEAAMAAMLRRPDQLVAMARAARRKAEQNFDQRAVLARWRAILGLDGGPAA